MLGELLEIQFLLAYHKTIAISESDQLPLAELLWYWKRFIKQRKDSQQRTTEHPKGLYDSGVVPRFEFLRRGGV